MPIDQARDYLTSLPGVGRKTAACVLLFALGLRDVPVDTHVSRVGTRLGLLPAGAPFEELHDRMLALTPPGEELELHVNLLRHGRRTCSARSPACARVRARAYVSQPRARRLSRPLALPVTGAGRARRGWLGRPRAPCRRARSAVRQHGEGDHRVVQRGGGEDQRVEDLVVAEDLR